MSKILGKKIKQCRLKKKLSLDQLAENTKTSKSYIWELENRPSRKPSADKLVRIAQALDVTIDYLSNDELDLTEGVLKDAFFRKFNKLEEEDKKKIEQIINLWGKKSRR